MSDGETQGVVADDGEGRGRKMGLAAYFGSGQGGVREWEVASKMGS